MTKLHLSDTFSLPDEVLRDVTAIVGRRGRGEVKAADELFEGR